MSITAPQERSFDSMLADALAAEKEGSDSYSSELDRMINGSAVAEQDRLSSKNLSDILVNIQDHGPAGQSHDDQGVDEPVNRDMYESSDDDKEELLARIHDDVLHTISSDTSGRMVWQIATLLLLVTLLAMISLFQFRTDDSLMQLNTGIEKASDDYIKQLLALQDIPAPSNAPPVVTADMGELESMVIQLNEEMQMLNVRLDEISAQQKSENSRMLAVIEDRISPMLKKLAMTDEAIAEAASNIVSTNKKLTGTTVAENVQTVAVSDRAGSWSVNLGTFSERSKADRANRALIASGIASEVHVAKLDAGTVYRLSVGGFTTKEAAIKFKEDKAKPLGYVNSWVRKS